jgi:hypothetical protein
MDFASKDQPSQEFVANKGQKNVYIFSGLVFL